MKLASDENFGVGDTVRVYPQKEDKFDTFVGKIYMILAERNKIMVEDDDENLWECNPEQLEKCD